MVAEFSSSNAGDITSVRVHLYRQLMQGKGINGKCYRAESMIFTTPARVRPPFRRSILRPTFRALQAAITPPIGSG
jgi:hypothetical protein